MLTDLEIRDYQSLHALALKLGMLTVVTGPSSSGKSATIRAMTLLARNARGTSYITHGAKSCSVGAAEGAEGWAVTITRGARGKDAYRLSRIGPPQENGLAEPAVEEYTKLAGRVPAEVTALLRLTDLNFAGQFDRPYLLTDSAGEVARTLGGLTNVTLLFSAARLANTRRLRLAQQLADTRAELARLNADVQRFRGLKARQQAAQAAAEALRGHEQVTSRASALRAVLARLRLAETIQARAPAPLPDISGLTALLARRDRLRQLRATLAQAALHDAQMAGQIQLAADDRAAAGQQLRDLLEAAGICPTCGQAIPHYTEIR